MIKVLLTGFKPFGGEIINPSYEAVKAVKDIPGYEVCKLELPVIWHEASKIVAEKIDEYEPDVVLMVGQAGGATSIRIERVGLNFCSESKDELGHFPNIADKPIEGVCVPGGNNAYFSTYNYKKILKAISNEQIPVNYSLSAGGYICNDVLYCTLKKNYEENRCMKVGFIHVPYIKSQKPSSEFFTMELEIVTKAIEIAVANSI